MGGIYSIPVTLVGSPNSQAIALPSDETSRRPPSRALICIPIESIVPQTFLKSGINCGSEGAILIFPEIILVHELIHSHHHLCGNIISQSAENPSLRGEALGMTHPDTPLTAKRRAKINWVMSLPKEMIERYYTNRIQELLTIAAPTWKTESEFLIAMGLRRRSGWKRTYYA